MVFSTKTLQIYRSVDLFSKYDEKTLFTLRRDLKNQKKGILLCATCLQPLFIAGTLNQALYFRHMKDSDDCPIKTTSNLSKEEIEAMKFNGQKEGAQHKNNKLLLASILRKDPLFESVEVEKTFKDENSSGIAKHWRRPDISAKIKSSGMTMVFELQVSTTFLDVIIARDEFYKRNKASILWVFLEFNNDTFTQKDIFYSSGMNAFVFDSEAIEASNETGKLHFNCHYIEYVCEDIEGLNEARLEKVYRNKLIEIEELKFDSKSKKPYFFNVDSSKEIVTRQVKERTQLLKSQFKKEMEEAKRKYKSKKQNTVTPRPMKINSSIAPALYEQLKLNGKHNSLKCSNCGNTNDFRSVACFITCNECNSSVDW
ncbi:DUF6035 family protein [Pseudoalteromonas sp. NBT06-2]|uniref:DUF6035 family protein n=1 Tax=Pseudoalteromonas sp. NBT06-2 TaxID=2025950 RepID=UPI001140ABDD|nr:DUF6035 family protein [Pseudoalteromonas sp. NBT06-2]